MEDQDDKDPLPKEDSDDNLQRDKDGGNDNGDKPLLESDILLLEDTTDDELMQGDDNGTMKTTSRYGTIMIRAAKG